MDADLVADIDFALAALRRVIVRAIEAGAPRAPERETPILPPAAKTAMRPKPIFDRRPPAIAHGVCVDYAAATVSFAGKAVEVSPRQADVVAVLARAIPHVIPRAEIAKRAWLDLAPSTGDVYLSEMRLPLTARLASIGLALKLVPKFGFALMPADKEA